MSGRSQPPPLALTPPKLPNSKQDQCLKDKVQPKRSPEINHSKVLTTNVTTTKCGTPAKSPASSKKRSPRSKSQSTTAGVKNDKDSMWMKKSDEKSNKKAEIERNKEKFKEARAKAMTPARKKGISPATPPVPPPVTPKPKSTGTATQKTPPKYSPAKNLNDDCPDVVELEGCCEPRKEDFDASSTNDSSDFQSDPNEFSTDDVASPPDKNTNSEKERTPIRQCFRVDRSGAKNEKVTVDDDDFYDEISFSSYQTVYPVKLERQRTHAKVIRSRPDQWRRYGALIQIYNIGGYIQLNNKKGDAKKTEFVKPGTKPPPPPKEQPITTMEEFFARSVPKTNISRSKEPQNPLENTSPDALTDKDCKAEGKKEVYEEKKENIQKVEKKDKEGDKKEKDKDK